MGAFAATLAALAFASPTATDYPDSLVAAIEHDRGTVTGASFVARPDGATTAIGGAPNATTQPLDGSTIAYLSDGDATAGFPGTQSANVSHDRGTTTRGGHDAVIVSMRVAVPEDANCLTLGASFFSEDFGDTTTDDPRFFDSFLAELDPAAPWSAGDGDPSTLTAPANFAQVATPGGLTPVSAQVSSSTFSTEQAYGTGYDGTTQWHTFKVPVTPGTHTLELSIFDRADGEYDSTVLVDDLRIIRRRPEACTSPGRDQFSSGEDLDAPAVTIGAKGERLSGTAGTAESDARTVTVEVGSTMWSAPVRGGTWSLTASGLEPGAYTARATQADAAGNEGRSAEQAFTVEAPSEATPSPAPAPTAPASPGPPPPAPSSPPAPAGGGTRPATARCKVPRLRGKTLRAVGHALRRAHCRIGRIALKRSRTGRHGHVLAQSPKAGARRPAGTRVKLTLRR